MLLRERETPEGLLVSVCDSDCLGRTYADGDVSIEVTEDFYGGDEAASADPDEVVDSLNRAAVANLVGERAVGVAIDAGIIDEDRVLDIDGTRHAQLLWMR
ncbi:MAG: DUF424 domain-containing protein [Halobacteriota archaeon]